MTVGDRVGVSGVVSSVAAAGRPMQNDPARSLMMDFLRWLADGPRPYTDVMDAWRTSCPRLSIWEDALDAGWVQAKRDAQEGGIVMVTLTVRGGAVLDDQT